MTTTTPSSIVVLHDPAGVVEAVGAVVVLDDREDGAGVGLGGGEVGLVAVVLLARALVAGRDDPALGVEEEDRAGADLLLEARPAAPRRRAYWPERSARIRIGSRESSSGTTEWRWIVDWIEPA